VDEKWEDAQNRRLRRAWAKSSDVRIWGLLAKSGDNASWHGAYSAALVFGAGLRKNKPAAGFAG